MHICHTGVGVTSQICQSLLRSGQWFCSSAVWAHCGLAPCNPQTLQSLPQAQSEINTKIKQRHTVNNTAHIYCKFYQLFCSLERGNKIAKEFDRLWQMSRFVIVLTSRWWSWSEFYSASNAKTRIFFLTGWENNCSDIIWLCSTGKRPVCSHLFFTNKHYVSHSASYNPNPTESRPLSPIFSNCSLSVHCCTQTRCTGTPCLFLDKH